MSLYEAMANVYRALIHRCGCSQDFASTMLDAVCEIPKREAKELALMDLAMDFGITDVLLSPLTVAKVPAFAERVMA